jgi:2,3-bisphosphoglycerate-independent phosphoglycerate mutase
MKYAIVVPDGCADEPQAALGGRTPLQAAHVPHMDRIVRAGVVGLTDNVPVEFTPASDVATLSLFGYDPREVYTGRAPLEAAAMGLGLGPDDWAVRCNLVTIEDGRMRDFTAGHVGSDESRALIQTVQRSLGGPLPGGGGLEFHAGVSYRNLMIYRGAGASPFSDKTRTQPPHDVPDQPVNEHFPKGPGAELLARLMDQSRDLFQAHPVNAGRREKGQRPATQIWLWGQGRAPHVRPFLEVYGKRGAVVSAVDLVRGVGALLGWTRLDVLGATGYLDTDYAAKGHAAVSALADHDLVCVHVEAPDEASHEGRADAKVQALQEIDRHIVGPLQEMLPAHGEWRVLVSPDHRTLLQTRAHAHGPVPFAMAGTGIAPADAPGYDEAAAAASRVSLSAGHTLMSRFLYG